MHWLVARRSVSVRDELGKWLRRIVGGFRGAPRASSAGGIGRCGQR
jgi:hypothetical protein